MPHIAAVGVYWCVGVSGLCAFSFPLNEMIREVDDLCAQFK